MKLLKLKTREFVVTTTCSTCQLYLYPDNKDMVIYVKNGLTDILNRMYQLKVFIHI